MRSWPGAGEPTATSTASDGNTQDGAAATNAIAIGPLSLQGPTLGLAGMGFKDGELVLTIAIGVDLATLNFGGGNANQSQPSSQQSESGISVELGGVLGTFDITVDILGLISGDPEGFPIGLTGKWGLEIATLNATIPDVIIITGSGIRFGYDPNHDSEANGPQELFVVNSASIHIIPVGIIGEINPFFDEDTQTLIPGLTVRDNGFALGEAQLIFGADPPPGTTAAQQTGATAGQPIKIGSILEFDDVRVGVQNFEVTFGEALDFDGSIFIATGGARFFPGRPISATLSDRLTAEPEDQPAINKPDTEAARVTLEFENGRVKALQFDVDTFEITLGSFLKLTGRDFMLDTGAADDEELVSFAAVGAEVKVGSLVIGGEGRNFAFLGDGTFVTKPGFGVFLSIGSADGSSFKWPSFLPIRITEVGIQWPDIQADPLDFVLTLSASVASLEGAPGLQFAGTIEGVKIDIGKLFRGEFPIVDIAAIGVQVSGDLFGGEITAALIGGVVKLDAGGRIIETFDITTPVEERILFFGLEGGFEFPGVGGITIRLAVSELGPLGVFLNASVPGGILLEPNTGLSINDFSAGVEFFKSLPSIEDPEELRGPEFGLPTTVTPEAWLASVKQQVVTQYLATKNLPKGLGFLAAFTSPMIITGGAKVFTIYTSKEVFNGEVVVRFSTDGKFLVIGKLNFAADNISISGKLYADLSKIASGDVTVLFLADIPDQVRLLSIHGKLKMGFRNASGEEVFFTTIDPEEAQPIGVLDGPKDGGAISFSALNGRGFIDVELPDAPTGVEVLSLNLGTVTDLTPEFFINDADAGTLRLDDTKAPVHLAGTTFRFWTLGNLDPAASGEVDITFRKETWSYLGSTGEEAFNDQGVAVDEEGFEAADATIAHEARPYFDVKFIPGRGASVDEAVIQSIVTSGVGVFVVKQGTPDVVTPETPVFAEPDVGSIDPTALGGNRLRFYFAEDFTFDPGDYTVIFAAGEWQAANGADNAARTEQFAVAMPEAQIVGPFGGPDENGVITIDVTVLNEAAADNTLGSGGPYVDIVFVPAPGAGLDYDSILDGGPIFELTVDTGGGFGAPKTVNATPIPVALDFNDDFLLVATDVSDGLEDQNGDDNVNDDDLIIFLTNEGITRFRYQITDLTNDEFEVSAIKIDFLAGDANTGDGWFDDAGNGSEAATVDIRVEGPTADLAGPRNDGTIDITDLNGRNYIDITFPGAPGGFTIDPASITDLGAEFELTGPGLGTVTLDSSQAPVDLGGGVFRFWLSGNFNVQDTIEVVLPEAPEGKTIDFSTVIDPGHDEIDLDGTGIGTVALDGTRDAVVVDEAARIVSFPITGTFGIGNVTVEFIAGMWDFNESGSNAGVGPEDIGDQNGVTFSFISESWSFTEDGLDPSDLLVDVTEAAFLEVTFPDAPAGFAINPDSILDLADEFELIYSGQNAADDGTGTLELVAGEVPEQIDDVTFRYAITGDFLVDETTPEQVTVDFIFINEVSSVPWSFTRVETVDVSLSN
ncbi:MAG: hypothetical protein ACYS0D_07370, partial [Planctomycetota bacterium]